MAIDINWTTIISSGVVATVISIFQLVGSRYVTRALDHFEKVIKDTNGKGKK
jgi:hypothetical protein